jgi:hypothetical protein
LAEFSWSLTLFSLIARHRRVIEAEVIETTMLRMKQAAISLKQTNQPDLIAHGLH